MKTGGFFIITIILSLSIQAQTVVTKETGTIRPTSSSLYKAGKELVVSISIDITRDLSSNESINGTGSYCLRYSGTSVETASDLYQQPETTYCFPTGDK